jgi:hypothetical protein
MHAEDEHDVLYFASIIRILSPEHGMENGKEMFYNLFQKCVARHTKMHADSDRCNVLWCIVFP